ncbi:hypothetical protein BH20VER1_BH20VER1_02790 [soil metagenome]
MKKLSSHSAFFLVRALAVLALCSGATALAFFAFNGVPKALLPGPEEEPQKYAAVPGGKAEELGRWEEYWINRLTYPTGEYDPAWVRRAVAEDAQIARALPAGARPSLSSDSPLRLDVNAFTALGPKPGRMTGCSGCFDYGITSGRVNAIAIDPRTTTPGSIHAYIATVGGGVHKTTNCCSTNTTWTPVTDDPLISTASTGTIAIDQNNPDTVYVGTGDLKYGSFSMGSQGILKSTDAGATWDVLGQEVFGAMYPTPVGTVAQYQAVGKVRIDPNDSNKILAGTKTGIYISYDAGHNWTGPCTTNALNTQRQDITGLELANIGGTTRIIAAVGVRGFATTVQVGLGNNGANGLYKGTVPASGCPSDFELISRNDNGFIFGTQVVGSPYSTGAVMNAGSGTPYAGLATGNQLGRIDIAVAPSNPNYIYAQVASIAPNSASGCGNASGCQLGIWSSTDGGVSWSFMSGTAGGSLARCTGAAGSGDYPQNWYDQGLAVDPNNPDRLFVDTYDTWIGIRGGITPLYNLTCGYDGASLANHVVHVDQHALAFVPGSSNLLLKGSDGGIFGSDNAAAAVPGVLRNTWYNMNTSLNTIEFYSGDISGNFANSASPQANGGSQDNGSFSVTFNGPATGPVQWQMGRGGDGFYARIDPVGTGTQLRFWQGNNSGSIARCVSNCTQPGATWSTRNGGWSVDTQSFILPYDIFHGGIPGGDDCGPAGASTGCGNLIVGSTRVYETITGATTTNTWVITNNPATLNMTKQTLGNRSFINQVKYSPKWKSVAMLGTNDGNAWIGFNLGTGVANAANWVNVTGGNGVLPNRPILGIAMDPSTADPSIAIGYAAVGGFNDTTPTTPGHVFRVECAANCTSFTWQDKSGNLPNMPVDSVIVNPNFPQQVFAGTDIGLYYTDDITAASPVWFRFNAGLPNTMIWDMQIDRGATTLSLWTRGKGAYAWPLPTGPIGEPVQLVSVASRKTHGAAGTFDLDLGLGGSNIEPRSGGANGEHTIVFKFASNVTSVSDAAVTSGTGTVSSRAVGSEPGEYIVQLTGVTNAQQLTVTLTNVRDTEGMVNPSVSATLKVLVGDANNSGNVNASDISQVKSFSGQPATAENFRNDINASGAINATDVSLVKSASGTSLSGALEEEKTTRDR